MGAAAYLSVPAVTLGLGALGLLLKRPSGAIQGHIKAILTGDPMSAIKLHAFIWKFLKIRASNTDPKTSRVLILRTPGKLDPKW